MYVQGIPCFENCVSLRSNGMDITSRLDSVCVCSTYMSAKCMRTSMQAYMSKRLLDICTYFRHASHVCIEYCSSSNGSTLCRRVGMWSLFMHAALSRGWLPDCPGFVFGVCYSGAFLA